MALTAELKDRRSGRGAARDRRRRALVKGGALLIAAVLHGMLFITWKSGRPPLAPMMSDDPGAGGMSVNLVTGRSGSLAGTDAGLSQSRAEAPLDSAPPPEFAEAQPSEAPASAADDAGDDSASGVAAADGGLAEGAQGGASAALGKGGFDPWARASLAPASFSAEAESGLLRQAEPCLQQRRRPGPSLALTLTLDSRGRVTDVRRSAGGPPVPGPAGGAAELAELTTALTACSPYRLGPSGAQEVTVVIPAA